MSTFICDIVWKKIVRNNSLRLCNKKSLAVQKNCCEFSFVKLKETKFFACSLF